MRRPEHLNGDKVFQGARFDIYQVQLDERSGGTHTREVVVPSNAAVILPMLDAQTVVLIRNERFAVGKTLLELPAGTLEEEEDPKLAAGRELEEETGYAAGRLSELCGFYPTPGFCTETMHAYLAEDLTHVGQSLDETERIEVAPTPWNEAMGMIESGEIIDGKTIATLLYYAAFVKGGK